MPDPTPTPNPNPAPEAAAPAASTPAPASPASPASESVPPPEQRTGRPRRDDGGGGGGRDGGGRGRGGGGGRDRDRDGGGRDRGRGRGERDGEPRDDQPNLNEETIAVNRVMKVVKGGRVLRFSAVVAVGDGDGRVGIGAGKAREVSHAIQKAGESARRSMVKINLINGTIYHEIQGRHGASRIHMQPASEGTGIIAGGPARKLLQVAGARDILAKNIGSSNPGNILRAALNALKAVRTPVEVAARRGLPVKEMQKRHRLLG